ncbi:CRISPR-associated protein Cas2 [Deinococcus reticulitermitis]|uniref:CRISPR-associated endoribonuclease Cas2 n=1 Tax=Deinococcus reticulitermitis TaxID=856736 RepID=A0A1H7D051_9DEIO|nr:CRISPR-associated endonuclease Cas2 [Deinococcus reticulitermitis]SEJ95298.1 CRISPR-associated protein Cas2 [Deinococcus reticulitermitis]
MTAPRRDILVAFDTPSDRRRRRITRLLAHYGVRVQKSVFRVQLTPRELEGLWHDLQRVCLPEEDALLLAQIAPTGYRALGPQPELELPLTVGF